MRWTPVACLLLVVACSSPLDRVDGRINELMRERTAWVPGATAYPTYDPDEVPNFDDDVIARTELETESPPASALRYEALPGVEYDSRAEEAAAIQQRLERLRERGDVEAVRMDLQGAFRTAQRGAREYLSAEEDYILAAIRLLIERHLYSPRFFSDVATGLDYIQVDGDVESAMTVIADLRATQRLPYGGEVEAALVWRATENLRSAVSDRYVQTAELVLSGNIPLLRGAGIAAREGLISAERSLVYSAREFERFRREFLVDIASDYFFLLQRQSQIANERRRLQSFERELERRVALFEAGREQGFNVSLAENNVRSAQSSVQNAIDGYTLALDQFAVRLGLPVDVAILIEPVELYVPTPDIDLNEAIRKALAYRLDLQNARDRLDDSRRDVEIAKNNLLPDLTIAGSAAFPTDSDAREGGFVFEPDDSRLSASVTFGLPLDREQERLGLRAAMISLEQDLRAFSQFRDNLVLEVRQSARDIERARFNLLLAEERVRINELRQRQQEINVGAVTAQELADTENELIDARNQRDQSLTDLRIAILQFLVSTGQMRVAQDGTFLPLPGMPEAGVRPVEREGYGDGPQPLTPAPETDPDIDPPPPGAEPPAPLPEPIEPEVERVPAPPGGVIPDAEAPEGD